MGPGSFEGVRRSDVAVVVVLAALGVYLMVENIHDVRPADHPRSTRTRGWLVPVWLAAVLPLLWWRRNLLAVALLVTVVMASPPAGFGWVARCGAGLPLAWVSPSWSAPATPCAARSPAWRWPRLLAAPRPGPRLRGRPRPRSRSWLC